MRALVLIVAVIGCAVAMKSYRGHRLMRVVPQNDLHISTLRKLEEDFTDIDFWTEPHIGRNTDINVPPFYFEYITGLFNSIGMIPETIQRDLQKLIDITNEVSSRRASQFSDGVVGEFVDHTAINAWLETQHSRYPELTKIHDIGTTYEGRTQKTIIVGAEGRGTKPIIWVDSAIHAREWLTTGTTIWIINYMLTNYYTDSSVRQLMDHYDWHFLPVANPDGYDYTFTGDRLWRKTRSRNSGTSCRGTDPNRNWDLHWNEAGTSPNMCSNTYAGASAFSEKCTQNMRDRLNELKSDIKLYMAVHSYSQMWLTPWGYALEFPSDYAQLLDVANSGNEALRSVHGTRFIVGTPPEILYAASGGAYDWAKGVAGVKYSYTYELRPDGNAWNGFVVDRSVIEPSGQEVWASLADVAFNIIDG